MSDVKVDLMNNGHVSGEVAARLLTNSQTDPGIMRPYIGDDGKAYISIYKGGDRNKPESYSKVQVNSATLMKDEWKQLDQAVIPVAESRLRGVNSLIAKGLVYNLGNGMGTTVLESQEQSDAFEAELSMDGVRRGQGDRVEFTTTYLPIPIIHVDYEINARVLDVSRRLGNPLDTTQAERAARKVADKLEQMLFSNTRFNFGGGSIFSFLNYPHRETATLTIDWVNATGEQIVADVMRMKQASMDNHHYGPWFLYVPSGYELVLDEDYSAGKGENTVRERIMKIAGIENIIVVDSLVIGNVVLAQATSDVVRIVRGLPIQNIHWSTEGNMVHKYKVLTIQVPQIRSDYNNRCGIVHFTRP